MELCERLQELRKSNHMSQEELADKLGVSRQAVSKWESGQGKPELNNIIKLAEIYGVTTDQLLIGMVPDYRTATEHSKKGLSRTYKKMIAVIAVICALAIITVLFIATLGLMSRYGIA